MMVDFLQKVLVAMTPWLGLSPFTTRASTRSWTRRIVVLAGVAVFGNVQGMGMPDPLDQPRAEFAKYYRQIVGKEMPKGLVRFVIVGKRAGCVPDCDDSKRTTTRRHHHGRECAERVLWPV